MKVLYRNFCEQAAAHCNWNWSDPYGWARKHPIVSNTRDEVADYQNDYDERLPMNHQ
jgi:hypothetical protein